jgi:hypothetical protein
MSGERQASVERMMLRAVLVSIVFTPRKSLSNILPQICFVASGFAEACGELANKKAPNAPFSQYARKSR